MSLFNKYALHFRDTAVYWIDSGVHIRLGYKVSEHAFMFIDLFPNGSQIITLFLTVIFKLFVHFGNSSTKQAGEHGSYHAQSRS